MYVLLDRISPKRLQIFSGKNRMAVTQKSNASTARKERKTFATSSRNRNRAEIGEVKTEIGERKARSAKPIIHLIYYSPRLVVGWFHADRAKIARDS
jgi:hypothetical protein